MLWCKILLFYILIFYLLVHSSFCFFFGNQTFAFTVTFAVVPPSFSFMLPEFLLRLFLLSGFSGVVYGFFVTASVNINVSFLKSGMEVQFNSQDVP